MPLNSQLAGVCKQWGREMVPSTYSLRLLHGVGEILLDWLALLEESVNMAKLVVIGCLIWFGCLRLVLSNQ